MALGLMLGAAMLRRAILHSQLSLLGHGQQGLCSQLQGLGPTAPRQHNQHPLPLQMLVPSVHLHPEVQEKSAQTYKGQKTSKGHHEIVCKKLPLPTAHTVRLKPNHSWILPTHGAWLWGSVLGSGHEQEKDVTSHCSCRMSPPEPPTSAEPKELPKLTGSRDPQTAAQSKTVGKCWLLVWEPQAQHPNRARG